MRIEIRKVIVFILISVFAFSAIKATYAKPRSESVTKEVKVTTNKKSEEEKKKEEESSSPCDGLLSLLNRPANADSACVVPLNRFIVEMGYIYSRLKGGGNAQTFPDMQLRLGILGNNEFIITAPNYIDQSVTPKSGWTAAILGLKHEFYHNKKMVVSGEALFTLPSGSDDFGSPDLGATINGIMLYSLTKTVGLTFLLGGSSLTAPRREEGRRYNSVNSNLVLSWQPKKKIEFYGEIYGQSNTGPGEGSGANCDVGVQYLLNRKLEVDLSFGQRIYGQLGGFDHYVSLGLGFII